jgi:hypothetical protein
MSVFVFPQERNLLVLSETSERTKVGFPIDNEQGSQREPLTGIWKPSSNVED